MSDTAGKINNKDTEEEEEKKKTVKHPESSLEGASLANFSLISVQFPSL